MSIGLNGLLQVQSVKASQIQMSGWHNYQRLRYPTENISVINIAYRKQPIDTATHRDSFSVSQCFVYFKYI
jgi:hypothetical protein